MPAADRQLVSHVVTTLSGQPVLGATVTVVDAITGAEAPAYGTREAVAPETQPLATALGLVRFWLEPGRYIVRSTPAGEPDPDREVDIVVPNPTVDESGETLAVASGVDVFDGGTTTFVIPHGLGAVPSGYSVTPASTAAAAVTTVTADAVNLTVVYVVSRSAGTDNVALAWVAVA